MAKAASSSDQHPGWMARHDSLTWRLIIPVPIAIVIAVAVIWATVPQIVDSMATTDAILADQQVAAQFKAIRAYYTVNVVNKVVRGGAFQANIDHQRSETVIPLPATFLRELGKSLNDKDTTVDLVSPFPFPARKDRKLDDFQQQAWSYLTAHPDETFAQSEVRDGKHIVRVAVADRMTAQYCVDCHNSDARSPKTDWKLGDVRGVLDVSSNIDAQLAHGATLGRLMLLGTGLIGLLLLGMTLLVTRSVTRPLRGMVRDMNKLAAGDFALVLPGLGRSDEIGAMAEAVEQFKMTTLERVRREAEQQEAGSAGGRDPASAHPAQAGGRVRGRRRRHGHRRHLHVAGIGGRGPYAEQQRRQHAGIVDRGRRRFGRSLAQRQIGRAGDAGIDHLGFRDQRTRP